MAVEFIGGGGLDGVSLDSGSIAYSMGASANTGQPRITVFQIGYFDPDLLLPTLNAPTLRSTGLPFTFLTANSAGSHKNEAWYYAATPTGNQTIDFTFTASATFAAQSDTYRGVDLSNPLSSFIANGAGATATAGDATPINQNVYVGCLSVVQGATVAARTAYDLGEKTLLDSDLAYDATTNFSVTVGDLRHPYSGNGVFGYVLDSAKTWRVVVVEVMQQQLGADPSSYLVGGT